MNHIWRWAFSNSGQFRDKVGIAGRFDIDAAQVIQQPANQGDIVLSLAGSALFDDPVPVVRRLIVEVRHVLPEFPAMRPARRVLQADVNDGPREFSIRERWSMLLDQPLTDFCQQRTAPTADVDE